MKWNEDLPSVGVWQPKGSKDDTLRNALMMTCQVAQRRIVARAEAEAAFNIENFDSGLGVEDILREELANLLPQRYSVSAGIVNDGCGKTTGECDVLVRDHIWSPVIKPGATAKSRRFHFPIEGIYAGIEIKQTLGFRQLDDAMKKMVTLSRLKRPHNPYGHITENQHLKWLDKPGKILNPLHTSVFTTRLKNGVSFEEIVGRFGAINELLDRNSMVSMLCVLDQGTAWYSVESGEPLNADFMRDRDQPLILQVNTREPENAFYRAFQFLMGHLTRSVLGLTNVFGTYGSSPPNRTVKSFPNAVFNKGSSESN